MLTSEQRIDILTKLLRQNKFEECRKKIGIVQISASLG